MNKEKLIELIEKAYRLGFSASGEGYNAEYPFSDKGVKLEEDPEWVNGRKIDLEEIYQTIGELA
jgi:hypothetical protein